MSRITLDWVARVVAAVVASGGLSGCELGEIRQSLTEDATLALMQEDLAALGKMNETLLLMQEELTSLGKTNATLMLVQDDLAAVRNSTDRIVQLDTEVETGIERLDSVGNSLVEVDHELVSVASSLRDLDVHLASLRRTLQKINKSVPFVDIADDTPVADPGGK